MKKNYKNYQLSNLELEVKGKLNRNLIISLSLLILIPSPLFILLDKYNVALKLKYSVTIVVVVILFFVFSRAIKKSRKWYNDHGFNYKKSKISQKKSGPKYQTNPVDASNADKMM